MLASVVHECGHIFVVYLSGNRLSQIRLSLFGACINLEEANHISYVTEAVIAAGGPIFGILFSILFASCCPVFSGINLCLSFFNLLPVAPLDGGKILRSVLCCFFDVDHVDQCLKYLGVAIGLTLSSVVLFLSRSAQCTVGMILFSAFVICLCLR